MKIMIMILISMLLTSGALYGQQSDQPPAIPGEEQPEVLTRGPLHEAYAQPVILEEEDDDDLIVPKVPPPDIEEVPPSDRPVGEKYVWVPGYWAWDSERNDYIWISGCWRIVPSGKYWIPGYWAKVPGGYRWVTGFWTSNSNKEIEYLPAPPAVTYVAPAANASPDMIWVPPCWYWYNSRYTLRSGYWIDARPDWMWVPSHYIWTPRGHIFVSGHWDYPFNSRGVLFAPVFFRGHIHTGLRFSLSIAVDLGNLEFSLFTRPRYRHYYFGDYYDSFNIGLGIFPWFECMTRHTWYDPVYLHHNWRNRKYNPDWWQHERREYDRRRNDINLRPPRTYRDLERRVYNMPVNQRKNYEVAVPIKRIIDDRSTPIRFRQNKEQDREQISRHIQEVNKYARDRSQWESSGSDRKSIQPFGKNSQPVERNRIQVPAEPKKQSPGQIEQREIRRPVQTERQVIKPSEINKPSRETGVNSPGTQGKTVTTIQNNKRQERSDPVRVNPSPVIDKQKRTIFQKRSPSQPAEERVRIEKNDIPKDRKFRR